MKHRTALAAAATAALCSGSMLAAVPPAGANGDHDGDHDGYDVVIPLTERASKQLRDGQNRVAATGKADAWADDGQVVLSFPVAGGDHRRHGDGGDRAMALKGGVAYTGAGPDITWERLKVKDNGVITAQLRDGTRSAILRVAGDRHHRGGDHGGDHGGYTLVLTAVGAASLNNAAQGAPFSAGDAFAGGNDCR
ncbi:hypothetical protein [Nocardioides sp. SR21]|uniref:hypothetical protein n=1 Tax=Nocardioides sp. SR21 TaxID=2919501 RepID=UPI001FA9FAF1|nr:hypothetical protein [Nocardioides sp. SR21]